jgi:hypothetical protein
VEVFEKHADRGGLPATPLPKTGCVVPAIGVNSTLEFEGDAQRAATVAAIKNVLGAQVVRYGLRWNRIEPVEGEREWSRPDGCCGGAPSGGDRAALVVLGWSPWANEVPVTTPGHDRYVPERGAPLDAWLNRYSGAIRRPVH